MVRKKIYIYGVVSSDNIGDNVICSTFVSILRDEYPNSKIELRNIFYYPLIWRCVFKILSIIGQNFKKLKSRVSRQFSFVRAPEDSLIVFAGGQLFYECFIEQISEIVKAAELRQIKVNFYGCGTGWMTDEKRILLSHVLQSKVINNVFLRDDYANICKEFSTIKMVPDVAICCDRLINIDRRRKKTTVGLGVIDIENYNKQNLLKLTDKQYFEYISNIINLIRERGFDVELFCNGNVVDYKFACTIYHHYESDPRVQLAPRPVTSVELISLISCFGYTIASRLHALIISYAFGVPFYGLSWDLKIPSFCEMIGREKAYSDMGELNASKVMSVFETMYDERLRLELKEAVIREIKQIVI